jgi:hypothetical protein
MGVRPIPADATGGTPGGPGGAAPDRPAAGSERREGVPADVQGVGEPYGFPHFRGAMWPGASIWGSLRPALRRDLLPTKDEEPA